MASAEKTTETDRQPVGRVLIMYDQAKAISPDGTERHLAVESPVFAHDRIITEGDGRVSIAIDDDGKTQIDLDGMNDIIIDEDIFGGVNSTDIAEAAAEVEEVQEAFFVQNIDLAIEPAANATDSVADAGGGHQVADFDRVPMEGDVSKTAADTVSIIFHESDYTDLDNESPGDPLNNLIDGDDSTT
ncbi:MAG: hypothetical protein JRF05_03805 [Deltaproteobacteria bacterium]|jgi:hypothetical protein|nr:hypothetical protein [Deltaproteobacteria bacterium]